MEVGKNIYVDLKIPAMNLENFLSSTDAFALKIVETTGTVLPYLIMSFTTQDNKVMNSIKQNNVIEVTFGTSKSEADTFPVTIRFSKINSDQTGTGWTIIFGGFIYGKAFMVGQESKSYKGNSLLVAKQVIKESFGKDIITNITSVQEKQVSWLRTNLSSCLFLMDTLLHMDISPSFPLFAFDKFGNFKLKSFDDMCKEGSQYSLVAHIPLTSKQYGYMNNFQLKSYKHGYDLYSGYNRLMEISNAKSNETSTRAHEASPLLAATKEVEKSNSGVTITINEIQSDNVHNTYKETYKYNTDKLMLLASMGGDVELPGYYKHLAPLDLVNLKTGKDSEGGYYIVDTVTTSVDFSSGMVKTSLYLSRDNYNYIENYVEEKSFLKVLTKALNKVATAISDLKTAYAFALQVIDGTYMEKILSFAVETKRNLLRSFQVAGVTLDFNSQAEMLQSLILVGNSLMNTLIDMVFPAAIADVLRDFIIYKPSLIGVISSYVAQYVPVDARDIIMDLVEALFNVTDSLNSIAKDNGIKVTTKEVQEQEEAREVAEKETSEVDYKEEGQERVSEIIEEFENNTTGLDIPYPVIELTESQALLPENELKEYIATATIDNLTNLGYVVTEEDKQDLKDILIGKNPIDFNLIKRINDNAGSKYNYRFWGTFGATKEALYAWRYEDKFVYTKLEEVTEKTRLYNDDYSPYANIEFKVVKEGDIYVIKYNDEATERDTSKDVISNALTELTSFVIKKSYKDKYRTIPCTKIISASKNQRIFFACPEAENDLRFFVNSKRIELPSFSVDLGYIDNYGNKIMYSVYYTETGYNSNSVLFEVKKGGV